MNDALEKAKGALAAIAEDENYDGSKPHHLDLMALARTQAEIAQAEALTRIADYLERKDL